MDRFPFDKSVTYQGPKAALASLTGSPLWGISVEEMIDRAFHGGWEMVSRKRPMTPYGEGPETIAFSREHRQMLWIPSYGGVLGQDWRYHYQQLKVFWLLWQAGVKVLIVGGTSGIADWKPGPTAVRPGDIVFPWSFRTSVEHRGLPGTEFETSWPKYDLLLDDPFCPELARIAAVQARQYARQGLIRQVHTPQDVRVALVLPDSITFETSYDIAVWRALSIGMSLDDWLLRGGLFRRPRIATLHGDCVNPILARLLGVHVCYYHMVANFAQGLSRDDIAQTLYSLYTGNFAKVAVGYELWLWLHLPVPTGSGCSCLSSKNVAPAVFSQAMTREEK